MTSQYLAIPQSFGVYVHFPWCVRKCPYCDFLSLPIEPKDIPQRAYTDAVLRELDSRANQSLRVHSLFFGGGTPSLWDPEQLGRVIAGVRRSFQTPDDLEISVECNPSSFDERKARQLIDVGVNRVSVGVQSLDQGQLDFLGRWHDASAGLQAVQAAVSAGVARVSADLIYGVFGQTPAQAEQDVRRVAALGVSHLSAYALTVEPGTRFGERKRKGSLPLLAESLVAASFNAVHEALEDCEFEHYEISNFARRGDQSRHNLGYWRGEPYFGLGCGAWGTLPTQQRTVALRYRNLPSPERYMKLSAWPSFGAPPVSEADDAPTAREAYGALETLDAQTQLTERLMLGLRLKSGLNIEATQADLDLEIMTPQRKRVVDKLQRQGDLEVNGERWRIPQARWLYADGIIRQLV